MTVDFVSLGTGIASTTLQSARKAVAAELRNGKVNLYTQKHWGMEGETTLCVEAGWETLAKLHNAMEKMTVMDNAPAPKIEYHAVSCAEVQNSI